ncbi:hypothetical protein Tco_0819750 [Tanacetum coccineum]|uniref:Uncharacterized protein n=1 Tax=Tanacetum coccineum TaxID=301880 RepID=A0ABQ5A7G4_9ASTR
MKRHPLDGADLGSSLNAFLRRWEVGDEAVGKVRGREYKWDGGGGDDDELLDIGMKKHVSSRWILDRAARTSYSLPLEETSYSLPLEGTTYSLPPEGASYSLPPKGASYSLTPEGTSCSLPPKGTSYSLPFKGASYSLPPEETSCSLPLEGTNCSLPLEETKYSLVIASGPEVAFVTPVILVDRSNMKCLDLRDSAHFFHQLLEVYFDFHLTFLMAKKDMHTYVSRLKDTELETLITTYDIPLDLRPRLPDPNFRMINLPIGDTAIGIYSRIFDSSGVRIPFSSFLLAVLKYFKVHISQLVPLAMSIYDFLYMPSLDKVTIREEPHGLDTSILGRVADRTTSPAPVGTAIPRASPEEVVVTRPDRKLITKDYHAAKQKASTGLEISTNVAKKTRSNKKGSRVCSSGQATGDKVEQTENGTLDDDDQRDDSRFAMEGIENLNDVNQVEAHAEMSGGVRRATRASFRVSHGVGEDASPPSQEAMPAPDTQPLDANSSADKIANLLPFVSGPYYIPYPYDESSRSEYPSYTREYWEEIHGVNLGLQKKELYKDPKVCRTALDRFPTPVKTHRLRELSSFELSDHMSCAQQTQTIKRQSADLKQQNETVRANKEVSRKYRNERDTLAIEKAKIEKELVRTKSQLKHRERQAEEIQDSIASFFQSDFTPLRVAGFIPNAKEKFDRVIVAFPDTTFPFLDKVSQNSQSSLQDIARLDPDRVTSSHQTSSATASLRANTHVRHSTSSSGTFGHTSTLEHLKKKKKSVEKGGPSAA